jgi:Imidazolonepropionase and related amidohydrolases
VQCILFEVSYTHCKLQNDYAGKQPPCVAGTTTVECKTGYGLETEAELMLLKVLQRAKEELPIEMSITYCGAHAVPK